MMKMVFIIINLRRYTIMAVEKYSTLATSYANNPVNMGRMNDPTGSAWIKGLCGDTMEIYLVIEKGIISDAKFFTDGCTATLACGSAVTELVKQGNIKTALSMSPQKILDHLDGLPADHIHCAILATMTLHKALAEHLLNYGWPDT